MNHKKLKRRIRQCEAEVETIRTLPYYTLFNRENERAADLEKALRKLNSLQCSVAAGSGLSPNPSPKERGGASLKPDHRTSDIRPNF